MTQDLIQAAAEIFQGDDRSPDTLTRLKTLAKQATTDAEKEQIGWYLEGFLASWDPSTNRRLSPVNPITLEGEGDAP